MKDEILQKLKEIELMVLSDNSTISCESLKYHAWIDEMQGRVSPEEAYPWSFHTFNPTKNATYRLIKSLVDDLYYKEVKDTKEYHKNRDSIRRLIAEIVAMTMFYQEQVK